MSKTIALVSTALLITSLFWLVSTNRGNDSLEANLQEQKLKSEELLSEKLLLEKDIEKFKDDLSKLRDRNSELDGLVKNTSAKLTTQEAEYARIKRENANVAQVKRQRQELLALKNQLENELTSLRSSYAAMEAKNGELSNTIAFLQERNRILQEDLNRSMLASVDESQVQAVKGKNERLTVKARRTKKLMANFEVPAALKSLSFRISDPTGNILTSEKGAIAFTSVPSGKSFTASAEAGDSVNKLQRVQMIYIPKEKLKTGVYRVEILNENLYVGSLKVRLR